MIYIIKMAVPKDAPNPNIGKVINGVWEKLQDYFNRDISILVYDTVENMRNHEKNNCIGEIVGCDGEYYNISLSEFGRKILDDSINGEMIDLYEIALCIIYRKEDNMCIGISGGFIKLRKEYDSDEQTLCN